MLQRKRRYTIAGEISLKTLFIVITQQNTAIQQYGTPMWNNNYELKDGFDTKY